MRGRYAPSPTGLLHLGNARTALLAYAQARTHGGAFIMRLEDLDRQRSRAEYTRANLAELRWLGLSWDEGPDLGGAFGPYLQSERFECYQAALEALEGSGRLFACYLSRKDVQDVSSAPHGGGRPYGYAQRRQNNILRPTKQAEGKVPSLRFRVEAETLTLNDEVKGRVTLNPAADSGDFVVRRADGEWAYQLAVVVDDIAMEVTHVLRGDDLLPSTGAQLLLYRAFGAEPPQYAHVPLLLGTDGNRLAKRHGALTLTALRDAGVRPERVVGLLAFTLGLVPEPLELSVTELGPLELSRLGKCAFQLEAEHLNWLYAGLTL